MTDKQPKITYPCASCGGHFKAYAHEVAPTPVCGGCAALEADGACGPWTDHTRMFDGPEGGAPW